MIQEEKGGVATNLTKVIFADHEAVTQFADSEANGVELKHYPAYIRVGVARERDRSGAQISEPKTGGEYDHEDL